MDLNLDHLINHLESYITLHLLIYLTFNITLDISYINQFIIEPYSTILETDAIRNVNIDKTSYMDIKIHELYITTGDTDISVYLIISIVELIDSIRGTRTIIVAEDRADIRIIKEEFEEISTSCCFLIEIIVLFYVFILPSKGDSIILKMERTSQQGVNIMEREETSEHSLVDITISRIDSDVLSSPWTSHREGVSKHPSSVYLQHHHDGTAIMAQAASRRKVCSIIKVRLWLQRRQPS